MPAKGAESVTRFKFCGNNGDFDRCRLGLSSARSLDNFLDTREQSGNVLVDLLFTDDGDAVSDAGRGALLVPPGSY